MKFLLIQIFTILILMVVSSSSWGQASPGAIFKGDSIFLMKSNQLFKDSNVAIKTGDDDDPRIIPKDAATGSLYIQASTGLHFVKNDSGNTTNWSPSIGGTFGLGTDNCLARWDGNATPTLKDSVFCVDDLGVGTGLTELHIGNLHLLDNEIRSTGDVIVSAENINLVATDDLIAQSGGNTEFYSSGEVIVQSDLGVTVSPVGDLILNPGGETTIGSPGGLFLPDVATGSVLFTNENSEAKTIALNDGEIVIGRSGSTPVAGVIQGTVNQVDVSTGAGIIQISLPQDVSTGSSLEFKDLTLTDLTEGSVLFAATGGLIHQNNTSLFWDNVSETLNADSVVTSNISSNATNANLVLTANGSGIVNIQKAVDMDSTLNVDSSVTFDDVLIFTGTSKGVRTNVSNSCVTLSGGAEFGSVNGAQLLVCGNTHPSQTNDILIAAGSGTGNAIFRVGAVEHGKLASDGKWTFGEDGSTTTHQINGNINGSGSGHFTGHLSTTTFGASGSGSFGGNVSMLNQSATVYHGDTGSDTVSIRAPSEPLATYVLELPDTAGSLGQVLENQGSGVLDWKTKFNDSSNLLSDGSFQTSLQWVCSHANQQSGLDFQAFSGVTSAQLGASSAAEYDCRLVVTNTSLENMNGQVSCMVKTTEGTATFCADNDTGQCLSPRVISNSNTWQRYTSTMTVGGDGKLGARIITSASTTADIYVSGCEFTEFKPTVVANENVFSAQISTTGTVLSENIDFINGNCALSSGNFTCTFKSNFFTVAPNCTLTAWAPSGSDAAVNIRNISASSIEYRTQTGSTGSAVALDVVMACQRAGTDYATGVEAITSQPFYPIEVRWSGTNCNPLLGTTTDGSFAQITDSDCTTTVKGATTPISTSTALATTSVYPAGKYEACWDAAHFMNLLASSEVNLYFESGVCSGASACTSPSMLYARQSSMFTGASTPLGLMTPIAMCHRFEITTAGQYTVGLKKKVTSVSGTISNNQIQADNAENRDLRLTIERVMDYSAMSLKGLPLGPYSPAVTAASCAGWSTTQSRVIARQLPDNSWEIDATVAGTFTSATSCTLTVDGINVSGTAPCTAFPGETGTNWGNGYLASGAGGMLGIFGTAQNAMRLRCTGVPLTTKPTFVP
jgi:hypothetical protein